MKSIYKWINKEERYELVPTNLNFFGDIFFELIVECVDSEFFRDATPVAAKPLRFSSRSLAFCSASAFLMTAFDDARATLVCHSG